MPYTKGAALPVWRSSSGHAAARALSLRPSHERGQQQAEHEHGAEGDVPLGGQELERLEAIGVCKQWMGQGSGLQSSVWEGAHICRLNLPRHGKHRCIQAEQLPIRPPRSISCTLPSWAGPGSLCSCPPPFNNCNSLSMLVSASFTISPAMPYATMTEVSTEKGSTPVKASAAARM